MSSPFQIVGWLGVGVSSAVHGMYYPSLFCFVVFFPEVEHNWCVDKFYLQLGSEYDVGIVKTQEWCYGLGSEGGK